MKNNKWGFDYGDFDYITHVNKFHERKNWLFAALAEFEDKCPDYEDDLDPYYNAASTEMYKLGHPGLTQVQYELLTGSNRGFLGLVGRLVGAL